MSPISKLFCGFLILLSSCGPGEIAVKGLPGTRNFTEGEDTPVGRVPFTWEEENRRLKLTVSFTDSLVETFPVKFYTQVYVSKDSQVVFFAEALLKPEGNQIPPYDTLINLPKGNYTFEYFPLKTDIPPAIVRLTAE
jgi:hypothetical protein